jgi:hypothetical protein
MLCYSQQDPTVEEHAAWLTPSTRRSSSISRRCLKGSTGGNVRRDAIDTLGNDLECLFSILGVFAHPPKYVLRNICGGLGEKPLVAAL